MLRLISRKERIFLYLSVYSVYYRTILEFYTAIKIRTRDNLLHRERRIIFNSVLVNSIVDKSFYKICTVSLYSTVN